MNKSIVSIIAFGTLAISQASAAITVPSDTGGTYNAKSANQTYQVNTTKGKINITASGITLVGGTLNAAYVPSNKPESAVLATVNSGTVTCKTLTVNNPGSDTKFGITRWADAPFNVTNCNVNSSQVTRDGVQPGSGTCSGGTMKVKDDSVKLYKSGSKCTNTTVNQNGGGSALQFGWGSQSSGTSHTASGNSVSGSGYSNDSWEPNRGWVGGRASSGNTLNGISVSTINIKSLNIGSAVWLVADGGTVKNVNVSGSKVAGNFPRGTTTLKKQNKGTFSSVSVNIK